MRFSLSLAAGALVLAVSACKDKNPVGPKPGTPVVTSMTCDKGNGQSAACEIPLSGAGSFTIKLISTSCEAQGNVLQLTKPSATVLTEDGCFEQLNREWKFDGPFTGTASSATMAMTVTSPYYASRPQLRVTGASPNWTVTFEDGYDTDFNDMVFTVTANP